MRKKWRRAGPTNQEPLNYTRDSIAFMRFWSSGGWRAVLSAVSKKRVITGLGDREKIGGFNPFSLGFDTPELGKYYVVQCCQFERNVWVFWRIFCGFSEWVGSPGEQASCPRRSSYFCYFPLRYANHVSSWFFLPTPGVFFFFGFVVS